MKYKNFLGVFHRVLSKVKFKKCLDISYKNLNCFKIHHVVNHKELQCNS